jgi:ankyrin repeat protein
MQSTPLHYAAVGSHFETVQYLVKKGCNVLALDDRGETTIDAAKVRRDTSAVRMIGI